ncbi:hypothetical protein ACHAWF_005579 [Thalassiosira exigua]
MKFTIHRSLAVAMAAMAGSGAYALDESASNVPNLRGAAAYDQCYNCGCGGGGGGDRRNCRAIRDHHECNDAGCSWSGGGEGYCEPPHVTKEDELVEPSFAKYQKICALGREICCRGGGEGDDGGEAGEGGPEEDLVVIN